MNDSANISKLRKFITPEFIFGNQARLFIDQYIRKTLNVRK